jgi:transcription-repair coupling factor (superfamily II helicase)
MRDLEIRGAGNLLGAEQHGHLDAVGYDLYIKLLNDAVLEERGEAIKERYETKISTVFDAFIPEKYIKSSSQRMEIYKKTAHIENEADYDDIISELTDRFGKIPKETESLISIALIKAYASQAKFKKVEHLKTEIRLYLDIVSLPTLVEVSKFDRQRVQVCGVGKVPYISVKTEIGKPIHKDCVELIKFYIQKFNENI